MKNLSVQFQTWPEQMGWSPSFQEYNFLFFRENQFNDRDAQPEWKAYHDWGPAIHEEVVQKENKKYISPVISFYDESTDL